MCGDAKARVQGGKVMTFTDCRSTHRWSASEGTTLYVPYPRNYVLLLYRVWFFFYQKPSKFKQKLCPFPDPFSQLSYLFTIIIVKIIVWHFVWISFSWKIWIIIGRIVFVIRLLFLHIMLTFVHVFVWISDHIKNNCTWKYWFWYKYSENHCILVNFQLINQS